MRESDWTPSIVTERDIADLKARVIRHDWIALTLASSGMVALTALLTWLAAVLFPEMVALGTFMLLVGVTFLIAVRIDRRRADLVESSKAPERAIRDEFGGGTGWLVELIVHRGHAPLGRDRGMLWIEDRRLMYSGHRTSFALVPDMTKLAEYAHPVPGIRHEVVLPLCHRAGEFAVLFQPYGEHQTTPYELGEALQAWFKTPSTRRPEGEYPPSVRGPGAPRRAGLLAKTLLGSGYWLTFGYLLFTLFGTEAGFVFGLLGLVLGLYSVSPIQIAAWWRAWRDLGRIDDAA